MENSEYGTRPEGPPVLGYIMIGSFVSTAAIISSVIYMIVM